jgi:sulfite reductase (NADPH) flavoprotein alpha-component
MPTLNVPYIPDNAPFSEEQRAWLNGFLAGIFSSAPAQAVAALAPTGLKIAVLFASQSGTAESLARKLAKELKSHGHVASLSSLEGYVPASLAAERHAIFIASTYGEGDPPDAVQPFFQQLCLAHFPIYQDLSYAVLALGDSSYEHFCKFGIDLDQKLAALGATRICDRVDCDLDLGETFETWKSSLLERIKATATTQPAHTASPAALRMPALAVKPVSSHTRENPFLAPLIERRPLTCDVSSKLTLHLAFSIADSKLQYEAGDACGVLPQNDHSLVSEILDILKFSPEVPVQLPKAGSTSLLAALTSHLQITRLTRKTIQAYATIGQCKKLFDLLIPEQQSHLDKYTYDRGFIDLLHDYPGVLHDPADLVAMLPSLSPRLYSISSSPLAHTGQVHTTIAVVRYRSHNRDRGGVASTMLAERVAIGDRQPVYIQPNKRFRVPSDPTAPIIMIGPGTGIAPFRAFLHERRALGATGRNWLFFGERSAATDFLYRDELEAMHADGHLTRLDLAFSRDQERKIYVQDRIAEQATEFYRWLQDGASVYVCGDASRMAKDVDATLHRVVEQQAGLSSEVAAEYVQRLKDEHRYHRDVY